MEAAAIIIMLLVALSVELKLSFMRPWQYTAEALAVAAVTFASTSLAVSQSKAQMAGWLQSPDVMLDLAVVLTVDVAMQIAFCITYGTAALRLPGRVLRALLLYVPGLLIFPVAFCVLTGVIFATPGADFTSEALLVSALIAVAMPLMAAGLKWLLPERMLRLELIFYVNCIIALLGVIVTVNGRTATAGTNEVNLGSLGAVFALAAAGAAAGWLIYLKKLHRKSKS